MKGGKEGGIMVREDVRTFDTKEDRPIN